MNMTEELIDHTSKEFFSGSAKYWENIPATVDGMLGGFGYISHIDIEGSQNFLNALFKLPNPPEKTYALDCGSGIGRISKCLLTKHFSLVDLVEQNSKFLDEAKEFLADCSSNIGQLYSQGLNLLSIELCDYSEQKKFIGLQDFCPEEEKYDVIWCQWVLGYLQDDDLISFLKKCGNALKKNGILVIKENITSSDKVEVDRQDSSVTRSYSNLKSVFAAVEFNCIKEQKQHHLPRGLFPVHMFALRTPDIAKTGLPD